MPIRTNPLTHDYGWNAAAGRYTDLTSGRFVPFATVRNELETVITQSQSNISAISSQLQGGQITLKEWQLSMAREMKAMHTASMASARGGWAQMSQADWGYTGSQLKKQYEYLRNFARQIESGEQPLNGNFMRRSKMYSQAGRDSYEEMRRRAERIYNGKAEERRVLHATESCDDCIEEAGRDWQPIGTLAPLGTLQCRTNCRCTFEFR